MNSIVKNFVDAVDGDALNKLLSHIHKLEDQIEKLERDLKLEKIRSQGLQDHIDIIEDQLAENS